VVDALSVGQEFALVHGRRRAPDQGDDVQCAERREGKRPIESRARRHPQRQAAEIGVRIGLRHDREASPFDGFPRVELDLDPGVASFLANERLDRSGNVQRMRHVALELAVALHAPDHGGVEADAGVEQERTTVRTTDADALRRPPGEGREQDVGGIERVVRVAERARVHVRRSPGKGSERGRGVEQAVGRLVERAVAGQDRDDIEPVVGRREREPCRVAAARGFRHLDVVLAGEQLANHHPLARGDRRRGRVDEQQDAHESRVPGGARRIGARAGPACD
jgi:hypothetical protein